MSDEGGEHVEAMDIEGGGGGGDDEEPYTEIDHENLCDRLQGACAGICIGLLLFFGSFPLLFWNEGRAVERYDALDEAESQVTSVSASSIDPANDGLLVHFTANVTNGGGVVLEDPIFGIRSEGLKLRRDAEMYQWVERVETTTSKTTGGGKTTKKTYRYEKQWSNRVVDSRSFQQPGGHENPSYMEFESEAFVADPILIGAYELPQELVGRVDWYRSVPVPDANNITDPSTRARATKTPDGGLYLVGEYNDNSTVAPYSNPRVGDQRVSFSEVPEPVVVTVVGVQRGKTLVAFVSETGEGGGVLLFERGDRTATEMFDAAEAENAALTWILRFVGFAAMALGLYLVFRPVEVFADVVPCVGSIVGCGIVFVSILIAAILSTITISIAWLVAHPMIGGLVLVAALAIVGCCAFGIKKLGGRKIEKAENDSPSSFLPEKTVSDAAPASSVSDVPAAYPTVVPTVYGSAEPTVVYAVPGAASTGHAVQQEPELYVPKV